MNWLLIVKHPDLNREGPGFESQPVHIAAFSGYFFIMPYTYILFSRKLNKYYVGACIDLSRRLYEHNIGHSKFTSSGTPWEVVYQEFYDSLPLAKKREANIKKMKSRKYIDELVANGKASRF